VLGRRGSAPSCADSAAACATAAGTGRPVATKRLESLLTLLAEPGRGGNAMPP
jgi:hypothetical protein